MAGAACGDLTDVAKLAGLDRVVVVLVEEREGLLEAGDLVLRQVVRQERLHDLSVRHAVRIQLGWLAKVRTFNNVRIVGSGTTVEIYKETGLPKDVYERFNLASASGHHMIGHTRMATESAVTTAGSHPFATGADLCLVHNGSLSNHNRLREELKRKGVSFGSENDSEVAAAYLTWKLRHGVSLKDALEDALDDLDGFFTFCIGTRDGFAVVRDPIACKHAVMAETDDWVAMATEYRAIAVLPGAENARIWEPKPATVYSWGRETAGGMH